MPGSCVSKSRSVVIWTSFALAMAGWLGAAASWIVNGQAAGIRPGFITALSVGMTFTITCCHTIVMPDKARLYGLGWHDGAKAQASLEGDPEPRRLAVVR